MPTPVWFLHPPTPPMMLVCTRFHGSDPRVLTLVCQCITLLFVLYSVSFNFSKNPQNPQSVILPKALACPNLQTLLPLLGSACCVDPTVMSPSLFTLAHLHNAQHVLDSGSCSLPVHCTGHHVLDAGLCMPAGVACSIVLRRQPCYTHIYMERGTGNKHNIANDALKNGI